MMTEPLSPIRGSRRAGVPAEPRADRLIQEFGRHPADISGDADERDRVARLWARGVPWPHIAAQIGKPELTLRRLYGGLVDPHPRPPTKAPAAKSKPVRSAEPRPFGPAAFPGMPIGPRVLLALEASAPQTIRGLMASVDAERHAIHVNLTALRQRGAVQNLFAGSTRPGQYLLTTAGRRAAAALRESLAGKGGAR